MKKIFTIFPAIFMLVFIFASIASAHVTVAPSQVPADSWQKFTIKVPTEKEIPTTKVKIVVPDGAEVMQVEPIPGWTFNAEKDVNGKITTLTWNADGNGLLPGQFIEFPIMAKVAQDAKDLRWKAYQTYNDGSLVKWIGPEDSDYPAPVTKITSTINNQTSATTNQTNQLPLYLSIIAVILGVIAIIISIVKGR